MSSRIFYFVCVPTLLLCGFGVGVWQNANQLWQGDTKFAGGPVRPGTLPDLLRLEDEGLVVDAVVGSQQAESIAFTSMTDSGVDFVYMNGPEKQFHLAETLGGGVASADYDSDGDQDLIFVNGGDPVAWRQNDELQVSIFRSRHNRFVDQSKLTGIDWSGYGHGCAMVDFNNDGFDDLFVTGYQSSALYINLGDGTFTQTNVLDNLTSDCWAATASFCDLDSDGDSDLYITCYADTPATLPTPVCTSGDQRIHCHPHFYKAQPDLLMENTSDGKFRDRSNSSGIGDFAEFGLGVKIADFDRDGSMDIFVANDGDRNLLFRASSPWKYDEIAIKSGLAFNGVGETMGSMGVACADFDQNGWDDLLTTNFALERNVLFSNLGGLTFVDDSQNSPIDIASRPKVGWSAVTLDADLDGWADLFVANGHVTQMPNEPYDQLPNFFAGSAEGFRAVSPDSVDSPDDYFQQPWHGRGAIRTDLNGDQRDDLVVSHIDSAATLLINQTPATGNVLSLKLIGTTSSRSANGATISVDVNGQPRVVQYDRNAGYLSSNSSIARIAVGSVTRMNTVAILWPCGRKQVLNDVPTGEVITVVEGHAIVQ